MTCYFQFSAGQGLNKIVFVGLSLPLRGHLTKQNHRLTVQTKAKFTFKIVFDVTPDQTRQVQPKNIYL